MSIEGVKQTRDAVRDCAVLGMVAHEVQRYRCEDNTSVTCCIGDMSVTAQIWRLRCKEWIEHTNEVRHDEKDILGIRLGSGQVNRELRVHDLNAPTSPSHCRGHSYQLLSWECVVCVRKLVTWIYILEGAPGCREVRC